MNPALSYAFGTSLALSADGNTLAVGASSEASSATGVGGEQDNSDAPGAGAVYVFVRKATSWSQQAYIKASNTKVRDPDDVFKKSPPTARFGTSVALSADGNTLAVGASGEASSATGVGGDQENEEAQLSGAVYVFARSDANWMQESYIKASNTGAGNRFGASVSLSADGSTLAVGAMLESSNAKGLDGDQDNDDLTFSGAVYVFARTEMSWKQQAYVKASNTDAGDRFGASVSLSADGNTLAVAAPQERSNATGVDGDQEDNSGVSSGAVYVFARTAMSWSQSAYLKASNLDAGRVGTEDVDFALGDSFGSSIALSADGKTLAAGAIHESSNATGFGGDETNNDLNFSGAVYVFKRTDRSWSQQAYIKGTNAGAGDYFGWSVAFSANGDTLATGATGEGSSAIGVDGDQTDNSVYGRGAVYVYGAPRTE